MQQAAPTPRFVCLPYRAFLANYGFQDFFCSPGDPLFYFHHGMLDRVWWIWQMIDPENRIQAVPGLRGNVSELVVDLGWTAPPVKLEELNVQLGGLGGELCYIYV